ncbi:hypothetical protein PGTUg99_020196 [Puccinia graminis f. sp. tritici]|uniref:Uncharacterized protein n=1 Tax=Puccinia graminis f. sp. tritici TaxID=56615 RepID=A0A5B0S7R3_PUCGR|nr:hypothetical protein PGTUg99_020196 [Puccinia graminis f. sp. tritici]
MSLREGATCNCPWCNPGRHPNDRGVTDAWPSASLPQSAQEPLARCRPVNGGTRPTPDFYNHNQPTTD